MTKAVALLVLAEIVSVNPYHWKQRIRDAWISGNYDRENLEHWSQELQQIRNEFGPSWLNRVRRKGG